MPPDPRALVRAYVAARPPHARRALKALRTAILAVIPHGKDGFSYRIPAIALDGKVVIWYAAFAEHASLFPIGPAIRRKHAKELAGFRTATGTVRFPLTKPMPIVLVKRLVKARSAEFVALGR